MLLEYIKHGIKEFKEVESLDKEKMAIIVMGEGESCGFEEKVLIALTLINRIKEKKIRFNSIFKDYHGWDRDFKISNSLEKVALEESIEAINIAEKMYHEHPEFRNVFFFNLSGRDPKTIYQVKKVNINGFKHTFFEIIS
jgi:hypothetical protein